MPGLEPAREKCIVGGRYLLGVMRRQLRVVGGIEDGSLQIHEMQWANGCC
jgi:hypothetical protein